MTEKMTYTGPHFTIGAIGAASHGKTELLRAILKVQSDKGLADYRLYDNLIRQTKPSEIIAVEYKSKREYFYTHIDCAGGDEYPENMVAALAHMDFAILVVSIVDGVTQSSHEHVRLARETGISTLIVYMNKCDEIDDPDMQYYFEEDIRGLLNEYNFNGKNAPVVRGSALKVLEGDRDEKWVDSIHELLATVDNVGCNLM